MQISDPDSLDSIPAQSCIQMGYSNGIVKKAISVYIKRHGNSDYKAEDLAKIILDLEDQVDESKSGADNLTNGDTVTDIFEQDSSVHILHEGEVSIETQITENRYLKKKLLCTICEDAYRCILFQPCSHLLCCKKCASPVITCIGCGQKIANKLNVRFGRFCDIQY